MTQTIKDYLKALEYKQHLEAQLASLNETYDDHCQVVGSLANIIKQSVDEDNQISVIVRNDKAIIVEWQSLGYKEGGRQTIKVVDIDR